MRYFEDSSADSPIPLAVRPGMRTSEVTFQSETYWVAKDPHQQEFHHFNEQEYAILQWLDGRTSFQAVKDRFNRRFTPERINFAELASVLRSFIQKSVVVPTNPAVGASLLESGAEKRRKQLAQKLKSVTAIKWKGWNPDRFLDLTYPLIGWFFSLPTVVANCFLLAFSLVWIVVHYQEFFARLPELWSFVEPENWVSLGLTVVIAKLFHELGHAYVNRRFGGRCQEIGVMIFFFMPTLYCNASDSWLLPNKWQRMAIGMGGVYVETFLFSMASLGWWFSLPGDWNTFCMNMMLVCSISAILTNGNPLLRYDGYFVLADWLEIPNLSQKANAEIRRQFLSKGLGIESEADLWTSRHNKRIYLIYGLAAFLFRLFLILTIACVLIERFAPFGLQNVALVIATLALITVFAAPVQSMRKYFLKTPGNLQKMNPRKGLLVFAVAMTALLCVAFLPIPYHVLADCSTELTDRTTIESFEDGILAEIFVKAGDQVRLGDPIARLLNTDLEKELNEVDSEIATAQTQLLQRQSRVTAQTEKDELPTTTLVNRLAKLKEQRTSLSNRLSSLTIRAEKDGVIFGITDKKRIAETYDDQLNQAFGSTLQTSNLNAHIRRGDAICYLANGQDIQVHCVIEPRFAGLVLEDQSATVLMNSYSKRLSGTVQSVSQNTQQISEVPQPIVLESDSAPIQLAKQQSSSEEGASNVYKDGQTLTSTVTQAIIDLEDQNGLVFGSTGTAKIFVGYRTPLWRLRNWWNQLSQSSF